ncbi:ABC transporter substrate-binding protein [Mycolicibacterium sp.]|uniref:ABC transporter substrate-binding protein n=1 Tax=Mycolicibacterium sp. TaxID=2320850 RepID=UPI0025DC423B|nr:ABC transporter substrate-binding protein [Mycolicibacterium sp.]MCB9410552.1 ABC transporter substrate-binding protein [Mycolicibacterium sp.]
MALLTAACSRTGTGPASDSGPVAVTHVFGETTVPVPPTRVVCAGLTEQDDLLAVGVIPIAVTNWFGDQPFGVWPWARDRLDGAEPAVLSIDHGIQVDEIGRLKPDLIVAVNAGLDADTYRALSSIAPTIAQSGGEAYFEPWREQATAVATAVFKSDQMDRILRDVDERFAAAGQANPQLRDRTAVLLDGRLERGAATITVDGWRTEFLTAMGLRVPDNLAALASSDGTAVITGDDLASATASADVLIWCTDSDAERDALLADPAVAGLDNTAQGAAAQGRNVFTTGDLAAAIAFASPLSYPVVAGQLPALVARALD